MKKIIYILGFLAVAVSCTKNIENDAIIPGESVEALFSDAEISRVLNNEWQSGDKVGIYALDKQKDVFNEYGNIPYEVTSYGSSSTSFAAESTVIYFPTDGSEVTFLAYSPYSSLVSGYTYNIDLSSQDNPELIDLLVSNTGVSYTSSSSKASLNFVHKLSKLVIKLEAGQGLTAGEFVDAGITINNVSNAGTYDLWSDALSGNAAEQTIVPRMVTNGVEYDVILVPSTYNDMNVVFAVGGKDYTWDASGLVLEQGKEHSYTITISESEIIPTLNYLNSWGNGDEQGEDLYTDTTLTTQVP